MVAAGLGWVREHGAVGASTHTDVDLWEDTAHAYGVDDVIHAGSGLDLATWADPISSWWFETRAFLDHHGGNARPFRPELIGSCDWLMFGPAHGFDPAVVAGRRWMWLDTPAALHSIAAAAYVLGATYASKRTAV